MALRDTNLLNIINLNDSLKTSISENNLSDMIKVIYQMRIFVGKMVFNLHKLHLYVLGDTFLCTKSSMIEK